MKLTATQLRKIIAEEVSLAKAGGKDPQRFLHGFESGHPMDDEGYMLKSRMASVKEMAETICDLLEMGDQLPAWVQDLVASAHTDLEHVKDYLVGDEKLRSYSKDKPPVDMPMESRSRRGGMILEGHARITPEEMSAWMGGDWGYVDEAFGGMMPGRDDKFMHPSKPPAPPMCADCGKKMSPVEKDAYEAEGGQGYPEVCMDCAEMPVREGKKLSEGHSRITEEEFAAWKSGDWGYVSEAAESRPVDDWSEVEEVTGSKNAVDLAAMEIGSAPDEVEFWIGPGPAGPKTITVSGGLTGKETHYWNGDHWERIKSGSSSSMVREMTCEECGTKFMPTNDDLEDSLVAGRGPTVVAACPKCGCYNEDPIGKY